MDGAETVDHGGSVDSHDAMLGKTALDDVERTLVVAVSKDRNDNGVIADVKVRVARRQPSIVGTDITRHGKRNDIDPKRLQAIVIAFQNFVVFI